MPLSISERRAALAETCTSLADLAASLDAAQWSLPTGCPGWTVFDQVAHVASLESLLAGIEPIPYVADEMPYVRNSIGTAMENLVGARRGWETARLVEELREVTELRQRQLADVPDDGTVPGPTGKPMPVFAGLSLRTFDCLAHELDVRRAVGQPGGLDGLAGDLVREWIPYLLGRTWSSPVALVVDGQRIAVGEGEPTVTFAGSLCDLVAVTTGRSDVPVTALEVSGDEALAAELLKDIALTP